MPTVRGGDGMSDDARRPEATPAQGIPNGGDAHRHASGFDPQHQGDGVVPVATGDTRVPPPCACPVCAGVRAFVWRSLAEEHDE